MKFFYIEKKWLIFWLRMRVDGYSIHFKTVDAAQHFIKELKSGFCMKKIWKVE